MDLTIFAPAKVNLHLSVLGRRDDGYHELLTIMQPLDVGDEVSIDLDAPGLEFTCDDPALMQGNLVEEAARAWFRAAGIEPRARIHLAKSIPVAAGLGGGSSDAAAALMGLNALHEARLEPRRLVDLAAGLGADVPFFLAGCTALCSGVGEKVDPWPDFPALNYVLVNPGVPVSTARVYRDFDLHWTKPGKLTKITSPASSLGALAGILRNDLEPVTRREHPEVAQAAYALQEAGALAVMMSGSGPTVFGVFADDRASHAAASRLPAEAWWVQACRGLAGRQGSA